MIEAMKQCMLVLLIMAYSVSWAQSLSGKIVDEDSGEALEYVNIRVLGKNIGVISSKGGEFTIDLSRAHNNDTLKFSYIGYQTYTLAIGEIDLTKRQTIKLHPNPTQLNQITIRAKQEVQLLGNSKVSRKYTGWGDFESQRGRIRGLLIKGAECPVKIKSFSFRINHNEWDSVAFRINFLKVENGSLAQSILEENIYVVTDKKHKWVKIELSNYDIVICKEIVATLEWVDAWGKVGEYSNLLTFSLGKEGGHTFSQEAGQESGSLSIERNAPAIVVEVYGK